MSQKPSSQDHGGLRATLGLGLALAISSQSFAADFRGVSWGASREEVRATEKLPFHHDIDDEVAYWNFELAGVEAGLKYYFVDDALVAAHYFSRRATEDPAQEMADFEAFERQFSEHFGPHQGREWVWADGAARGEGSLEDITAGRAELVARWTLETAQVKLLIAGRDGEVKTVRAIFEPLETPAPSTN